MPRARSSVRALTKQGLIMKLADLPKRYVFLLLTSPQSEVYAISEQFIRAEHKIW